MSERRKQGSASGAKRSSVDPIYRDSQSGEPREEPWSAYEWYVARQRRKPRRAKM